MVIRAELLELTADRVPKQEQFQFALGVVYMAHKLGAISDKEHEEFEQLIAKHGL